MSIYGWWFWSNKKNSPPVNITFATHRDWIITICIVFAGWGALVILLMNFTASTVPLWDAWVTSTAWAGMWLLARRKIENWILLNVSNLFAIPLLFQKQLPLFAALTIFLFIVACKGYFDWIKKFKVQSLKFNVQIDHRNDT
jgi:nicotinamide mononucleotide transporter